MSDRASVSVSADNKIELDKYAEKKGLKTAEAIDKLLTTAFGRLGALNKYAKAVKKAAKEAAADKPAKSKVKAAKKEKTPKVAKPKKEKNPLGLSAKPKKKAAKKQLAPSVQAKVDAAT